MGEQPMTTLDAVQRYHRRDASQKTLDPPPKRCTSPRCRTGWERVPGGQYCLACHQRMVDRGDELRARKNLGASLPSKGGGLGGPPAAGLACPHNER